MSEEIDQRAQNLLKTLVERYIREGEPIGSKTLCKDLAINISPATVRSVMHQLEERGFVKSPHTSAGRIPTEKGLRFFVDTLVNVQPLQSIDLESIKADLSLNGRDLPSLLDSVSNTLSQLSSFTGLVTMPRREHLILRQVDFLPMGQKRILVILVVNDYEVQNKVIQVDKEIPPNVLEQIANYLNSKFAGKDLNLIRKSIASELAQAQKDVNDLMSSHWQVANEALNPGKTEEDYIVAGQTNLLNFVNLSNMDQLVKMFDAFKEKSTILHLLDKSINAEGMQIFIGKESGYSFLEEFSIVTSPYVVDEQVIGVLGVIGPNRMNYEKVISIVDVTAKLLGSTLNKLN